METDKSVLLRGSTYGNRHCSLHEPRTQIGDPFSKVGGYHPRILVLNSFLLRLCRLLHCICPIRVVATWRGGVFAICFPSNVSSHSNFAGNLGGKRAT